MAIYHCSVKIGSRGKGQSAVAAAAYRSGEKLTDKETGLTSDYTRKGGVVFSEISLCENAPAKYADRSTLWNAVHQIEKAKDARLWREIEVALPKELSREEQIAAVRDFVKQQTAKGMCADWSLHDKGDGNPHAHIMLTVRSIELSGKWAAKSRKVYDLDENGERIFQKVDKTGRKQYKSHKEDYNDWNAAERVEEWRAAWAECCNARLAECDQIDHRSYARQGVNQIPTIHEGYAARQRVADGLPSDRVQINQEIKQISEQLNAGKDKIKQLSEEAALEKKIKGVDKLNKMMKQRSKHSAVYKEYQECSFSQKRFRKKNAAAIDAYEEADKYIKKHIKAYYVAGRKPTESDLQALLKKLTVERDELLTLAAAVKQSDYPKTKNFAISKDFIKKRAAEKHNTPSKPQDRTKNKDRSGLE